MPQDQVFFDAVKRWCRGQSALLLIVLVTFLLLLPGYFLAQAGSQSQSHMYLFRSVNFWGSLGFAGIGLGIMPQGLNILTSRETKTRPYGFVAAVYGVASALLMAFLIVASGLGAFGDTILVLPMLWGRLNLFLQPFLILICRQFHELNNWKAALSIVVVAANMAIVLVLVFFVVY